MSLLAFGLLVEVDVLLLLLLDDHELFIGETRGILGGILLLFLDYLLLECLAVPDQELAHLDLFRVDIVLEILPLLFLLLLEGLILIELCLVLD